MIHNTLKVQFYHNNKYIYNLQKKKQAIVVRDSEFITV